MWCNVADKYPELWEKAMMMIISFPTSYLVEKGFSAVMELLSKKRNRLDICGRGDLRLFFSKFTQDVNSIVSGHQAQPS